MSRTLEKQGDIGQYGRPNWDPLLGLVGEELTGDFMWMYEVDLVPRGHLQAYKHIDTRRYLHLDGRGNAYEYHGPNRYRRVPVLDALVSVFASLPILAGVTREQLQRSWEAVEDSCAVYIPRSRPVDLSPLNGSEQSA
jgi:hypothetical protein